MYVVAFGGLSSRQVLYPSASRQPHKTHIDGSSDHCRGQRADRNGSQAIQAFAGETRCKLGHSKARIPDSAKGMHLQRVRNAPSQEVPKTVQGAKSDFVGEACRNTSN